MQVSAPFFFLIPCPTTHPIRPISRPLHLVILLFRRVRDPEDEVDDHGQEQDDGQEGRPEAVVEAGLAADAYRLRAPVVREQGVQHGGHGDDGEQEGRDEGRPVAEVQHAHGEGAEDYGEVQPRQEGSLVGEEDLGLDAGGEGNPLA